MPTHKARNTQTPTVGGGGGQGENAEGDPLVTAVSWGEDSGGVGRARVARCVCTGARVLARARLDPGRRALQDARQCPGLQAPARISHDHSVASLKKKKT